MLGMIYTKTHKLTIFIPIFVLEGTYIHTRGVHFLPLMMQYHYRPHGWLGLMIADRLYINFDPNHKKVKFETAYADLKKHIEKLRNEVSSEDTVDGPGQ